MYPVLLFDCDGVLVDSERLALEVETRMLAEIGLTYDRDDYAARFLGLSHEGFFAAVEAEGLARLGRSVVDEIRTPMEAELRRTMIEQLTEVPGARAAVEALPHAKAVASSSTRRGLERKLRQTGLWDCFAPHVYSAEHVARAKPAPDLFLHAAAQLRAMPGDCLVIEDSLHGIAAAKAAGMRVWGFVGGGHAGAGHGARLLAAGAERIVQDWPQMAALLAA